jgi:hypothetical protein
LSAWSVRLSACLSFFLSDQPDDIVGVDAGVFTDVTDRDVLAAVVDQIGHDRLAPVATVAQQPCARKGEGVSGVRSEG